MTTVVADLAQLKKELEVVGRELVTAAIEEVKIPGDRLEEMLSVRLKPLASLFSRFMPYQNLNLLRSRNV